MKIKRTRYVTLGPAGRETTYDTHPGELHDGVYPPPAADGGGTNKTDGTRHGQETGGLTGPSEFIRTHAIKPMDERIRGSLEILFIQYFYGHPEYCMV